MTDTASLGDRMKMYEQLGENRLIPLIPAIARLDGKTFHSFTKDLERPYDKRFSDLMVATTRFLVEETNARIGYTQSDEITLIWLATNIREAIVMGGRRAKIISILASMTTAFFNRTLRSFLPDKAPVACFDCRVWNVPNETEAVNVLVWREADAVRNSIQMAGQSLFSHKELMHKSCDEIQEMLWQRGINWNDYPVFFKRGTYIRRVTTTKPFTAEEIEQLPPLHHARTNPDLVVSRQVIGVMDMPILTTVINRNDVVFSGADPEVSAAEE